MGNQESPVTWRASIDDRKVVAELMDWLGLKMPSVIRLALKRLHDAETARRRATVQSDEDYQRIMLDTLGGLKVLHDQAIKEGHKEPVLHLLKTLEQMKAKAVKAKAVKRKR